MTMRRATAAAALAGILFCGAAALAAGGDAESFVRGLYQHYAKADFNVFAEPRKVFSAELVAALDENDRCTPDGEVGAVDYDPLCQCQDPTGMRWSVQQVQAQDDSHARADVSLSWSQPQRTDPVRLLLVREAGGWRIADVGSQEDPSLLAYLRSENKRACAARLP